MKVKYTNIDKIKENFFLGWLIAGMICCLIVIVSGYIDLYYLYAE